ncbi:hypothetical protein PBY51_024630 [Eleginops maclovinus]|uniref:Metalloendopeptidase OMA1, mitochondrial n=1 Tax=Eleginops maclovinus TaxID=56733 RepID=A0AAN7Y1Q7_ELEMC|nr:hypothetical protein PBY51_024630 [Eleginops maclovinus]
MFIGLYYFECILKNTRSLKCVFLQAQFGRRWTKIAKLVGSRSILQVKSYARQYFKHKAKSEPRAAAPSAGHAAPLQPPQPTSSHASTLTNTVRIEKLSDEEDEEVDITDDLSDDGDDKPQVVIKTEIREPEQLQSSEIQKDKETRDQPSPGSLSPQGPQHSPSSSEKSNAKTDQLQEACSDGSDSADKTEQSPTDEDQEVEEDEEEEELKVPEQEVEMEMDTITEEEKQAIPEFFEGRPSKTPERYLKIRNYILDQWVKSKPKYLNKTSVRPGLKNCGDVNCIGRIHTYLELIGAVNFSCEQAVYNRPRVADRSKHKEGKDVLEAYQIAQRLQSMRTRKRRVRDIFGNWCDSKDLEGQTYEHLSAGELALRREEMKKHPKPCKISRFKGSFDPFQLIPCRYFGEDVQEPFQVIVCAETLLIMDMHAHVSRGEVIGLLGGTFIEEQRVLKICAAEPCNSVSTGLQCEMDPVSQTQACDLLSSLGFSVVGWYHSHPTFHPNPSVRDITTQDQFQSYFSRGGAPFIGMIVSPYDPANPSPHSQTTCLLVKESQEPSGPQKLPYRFDFLSSQDIPDWEQTWRRAQWIINKYSQTPGSVHMDRCFRKDSHLTFLEKMLSSLARYLEPLPDEEGDPFLTQIQALFHSDFIAKQQLSHQGESLNMSSRPVDSDDFAFDQLISDDRPPEGGRGSDPDSGRASISCHRTTDPFHLRASQTAPHLLFCSNGRRACFQNAPKPTAPLPSGHHFHTSAPVNALPAPLLWLLLKPLQKLTAIILGRSIRKWWVALPANRRQLMREWVRQRRWHLISGAGVAMVILALLLLTHLDESPVTGRTRLLVFSREKYMELAALTSEAYMEEFAELLVPVTDPRHQVVERLVQHLAERNKDIPEVSEVSWSVHVVQSPNVNAFVLPNGKVFMFMGMLEAVADVHQLTVVLGHEMAHAVLGHSAEQASLSHVVDLLSLILLTAIWALCPRDSLAVLGQWVQDKLSQLMFSRPYSRKLEAEADQVGLQLAAKACADVRAGPVFWQQMEIRDQLTGEPTLPEWMSTHPSHRNRLTQLDRLVPQALELRESCVCPALPATDPRVVFAKSVRVMLEAAKQQGRGGSGGEQKPHLPNSTVSLFTGLPAALLAQTDLLPSPNLNQEMKGQVSFMASESAVTASVPAPSEGEGSPSVEQSTS